MRRTPNGIRWPLCLAMSITFVVVALTGRAAGQVGATGSIIGQVTDESKGVLPGVTLTATSLALQVGQVTAVTDENGEYRLTPLPIGTYTVEYTLSGFQTMRQEGIRLTAGFTAKLDVVMKVGGVAESITVSGASPIVDAAATSITTHVTKEVLEIIPTGRNGYTALLELAPGARGAIDVGGSTNNSTPSFSNFGMREESWQAVDGVSTKTPNISDSGNFPDYNTFEEVTISTMGHEASAPSRGVTINTVVKSGGNDFHGKLFYGGTNSHFESTPGTGGGLLFRDDVSADVGGRIVRDQLWFYVGARYQRQKRDVLSCFQPNGVPCYTKNYSPFLTPKVTYQINANHRLVGMAWFNERIDTAITAPTEWSGRRTWGGFDGVAKGEWQGLKGNVVMSVLGGLFWNHSGTHCEEETCSMVATRDRGTGVITGLTTRSGEKNIEERRQLRANTTWFKPGRLGNHEVKFGGDFFHIPANRKQEDRGAAKNYRLNFLNTASDRIEILNAPVYPDNAGKYVGVYLQDSWTIGRRLTLNLGGRYAYDSVYENAGCREAAPAPAHLVFPASCWEKTQMPIFRSFVPRLHASYDITGDGKTAVKGGWGRYVRMRLFDHLQPMANNVISTAVYRWRDSNGNRDYDPGEINLDPNGSDFLSLTLTGTFTSSGRGVVNPDEQQPYTDEYSLQFERQLVPDLAVRILGLHAHVGNTIRLANKLRPYEAYNIPITSRDPGPDGTEGTADDPGTTITWYDYPASLAGLNFQKAIYANDPSANENYDSFEVAVSKRLSHNWQFQAAHSATKRHVPLTPNEDTFNTQDPNSEINAADDNWEWTSRVSGSYLMGHGILTSARFEHRRGLPYARTAILRGGRQIPTLTVNVEPIGSQSLPNINLLSLRLEKRIALAARREMQVRINLANALNTNVATAITTLSGSSYGLVTARVLPRVINFEIEYRF
jgi:hypothetical protein